ncbi:MAG: hypothetical protein AAFS10_21615, partial [Myxococcota bacterium]
MSRWQRRSGALQAAAAVVAAAVAAVVVVGAAPGEAHAESEDLMRTTDALQRWTHSSGATAYLVEKHDFGYVSFTIQTRSGALWDPTHAPGLAHLTSELMLRGAGDRNRTTIAEALEVLGTELDVGVGKTVIAFEGDALSRNLE